MSERESTTTLDSTVEDRRTETRLSFRFILIIPFGLVLVLVGLFISQPLVFVSVPMICLVGFLILQMKLPDVSKVEMIRTLEKFQIREEETCRVKLGIKNTSDKEYPLLQVRDSIPAELEGENTNNGFSITLGKGESRDLFYEVRGNYFGEYLLGPTILSAHDASGMIESVIKLDSVSKLVVFPKTAGKLTGFTIGPKTTRPRPGEIPVRRAGTGMDFFTTRQLLPGEHAKRINWRASARTPDEAELLVNDFVAHQVAETLIVVDCRSGFDKRRKNDSITSYSIRAAMSVAERLLRDKNRVGVLAIGSVSERVAPSYGERQFDRIALTLSRFNPGKSSGLIGEDVSHTVRYFYPRVSQIVLVSSLMDEITLYAAEDLARSATSYDLMIVSPNPLDFPLDRPPARRLKRSREGQIAWKLAVLERGATIARLEAARAVVLDWHVLEPLEQVVAAHRRTVARRIAQLARR